MRTLFASTTFLYLAWTTIACGDDTGGAAGSGTGGGATTGGTGGAEGGTTGTGGPGTGGADAGTGGEGTGAGDGGCSFGDTTPQEGMATIRLALTGIAEITAEEATWQVREAGTTTFLTRATSTIGGGDTYCPAWLAADPTKSYEVDVWIDENANFTCDAAPADVLLTAPVPAFVDDQATVEIVFDGTSNGTCTPFL